VSQRGPGKKIIYVDELWRFVSPQSLPAELQRLVRMGRAENLELISSSQRPRDFHADIRSQATEWVGFNVNTSDVEPLADDLPGVERICGLAAGSFLAFNRESGGELAGKLF
jgi:DNA helicase HerA-like ATPase